MLLGRVMPHVDIDCLIKERLSNAGWKYVERDEKRGYTCFYERTFKRWSESGSELRIRISVISVHDPVYSGKFGVAAVSIADYPDPMPYTMADLKVMANGIDTAENNLLDNGIPFTEGCRFVGRNQSGKTKRNTELKKRIKSEVA